MGTAPPEFNMISSEDVEGTAVYDPNGNEIGKVDHLMIDKISGQVRYAIMSFGGFWCLGHSHCPLPWSSLTYDKGRNGYTTNVTEQQLRDAPEFSDDSWKDRDGETRMHRHYNVQPYWNDPGRRDLSQGASSTSQSM